MDLSDILFIIDVQFHLLLEIIV